MIKNSVKMRQVMDWRAAFWAGLIAGAVFMVAQMILLNLVIGGSPWVVPRRVAAILLGESVLPPPATFDLTIFLVALLLHFSLSVVYALILAFIIHRWGLIIGIVIGALFGLTLYLVNYYTFSIFFPWFFPVRSWIDVFSHILFGAVAGGVYEALEVEEFVPVET